MSARYLTPQVQRRLSFTLSVRSSNDIDSLVAEQADSYLSARVYGEGNVPFEWELLRVALNERRRRKLAERRAA